MPEDSQRLLVDRLNDFICEKLGRDLSSNETLVFGLFFVKNEDELEQKLPVGEKIDEEFDRIVGVEETVGSGEEQAVVFDRNEVERVEYVVEDDADVQRKKEKTQTNRRDGELKVALRASLHCIQVDAQAVELQTERDEAAVAE